MILKCLDGPMDGAVYALSRETSDPQQRSTNRKPDGLWFDGYDDIGQSCKHEYKFDRLAEGGDHVTMVYRYDAPATNTGICEHGVADGDWCEPCNKAMKTAIAENQE